MFAKVEERGDPTNDVMSISFLLLPYTKTSSRNGRPTNKEHQWRKELSKNVAKDSGTEETQGTMTTEI